MKINLLPQTLPSILLAVLCLSTKLHAITPNFDVNDVSWLFPFPSKAENLAALISMDTLKTEDGQRLWPTFAFEAVLAIASGDDSAVEGVGRIKLPEAVLDMSAWKIAGVRFDPSAPGTAKEIIDEFGSDPQIRLILQPVTGTPPKVHDITIHLIYSFSNRVAGTVEPNRIPKSEPKEGAFLEIVKDLAAVKSRSAKLNVTTSGQELGVHPGLKSDATSAEVRKLMADVLLKHLPNGNLRAMAIMGLPNGFEPWIFVAIAQTSDGKYVAAPGFNLPTPQEKAQALSFLGGQNVVPTPVTNNRGPIVNQSIVKLDQRRGVSTAVLFQNGPDLAAKVQISGKGEDGNPVFDEEATNGDIVDIVANPVRSHFFNTDCVSCHTETTRAEILKIKPGGFAFKKSSDLSTLSDTVTPKNRWNVRNFGWGPPREPKATVSRRAFNETAESAESINKNYVPKLPPSVDQESPPANK